MNELTCDFCRHSESLANALELGWIPNYWRLNGDTEESKDSPVCSNCQSLHLHYDEDTSEYVLPFDPEPGPRAILRRYSRNAQMQYITLPNGKRATLAQYTAAWYALIDCHPATPIRNWDHFERCAGDVLAAIRRGLQDRINTRGGLVIREASEARIRRQLEKRVRPSCRWCGTQLDRYEPKHFQFCDAECRRSHNS